MIGGAAAAAAVDGSDDDMGGWQPGDTAAAAATAGALGLGSQLQTAQAAAGQVAQQIGAGYTAALGRVLANAQAGATASDLAAAMTAALTDPDHATTAALTQVTTASGQAALSVYQGRQVLYGRWITADDGKVCPLCDTNEAAGRVPMGAPYPSGDVAPPGHPNCRCVVIPAR